MDRTKTYRPDIDGLRAVAVLLVVLYHAIPASVPGGFIGVDIFFVISGYLITGVILAGLRDGRFSFASFYAHRVRRIFPALILILAFCMGYGALVLLPTEYARLGLDVAGGASFTSNLLLWHEAGYFDRASAYKPLLHLWSLGVEEQFYILWPPALLATQGKPGRTAWFLLAAFALSLAASAALAPTHPTADFYAPLSRLWELAAGGALALARQSGARHMARPGAASLAGFLLILICAAAFNSTLPFPGLLALLPVLGTVLLIASGPGAWLNRRILSHGIAVRIGLVSYAFYLWHWPLLSYATIVRRGRAPKPLLALGLVAAAFALAWLTTWGIESPIRRGKLRPRAVPILSAGMVLILLAGLAAWRLNRTTRQTDTGPALAMARIDAAIGQGVFTPTPWMRVRRNGHLLTASIGGGADAILFAGDSVLFQYGPRVQALADAGLLRHRVIFVTGPSCAPLPGLLQTGMFAACSALPAMMQSAIGEYHPRTVVLGAFWQGYLGGETRIARGAARLRAGAPGFADLFFADLRDEVAGMIKDGLAVRLILCAPSSPQFDPERMITRSLLGYRLAPGLEAGIPRAGLVAACGAVDAALSRVAAQTGAKTLDPFPDICAPGPACPLFFDSGEPIFADDKHLRPGFVRNHVTLFDPLLERPDAAKPDGNSR